MIKKKIQIFNVVKMVIIHKTIKENIVTNKKWKKENPFIFANFWDLKLK